MSVIIDGKNYDEKMFSPELQNYLSVRQEIQLSRIRHNLELEKIEVLTKHYISASNIARAWCARQIIIEHRAARAYTQTAL